MCDICGYRNANKICLKGHLEVHLNPDKGKCKICSKKFTNTKFLRVHSRKIHNLNVEPSKLCCNICHLMLRNFNALKYHKSTHIAPKTCPVCCKYIKLTNFSSHMKNHKMKNEMINLSAKFAVKSSTLSQI